MYTLKIPGRKQSEITKLLNINKDCYCFKNYNDNFNSSTNYTQQTIQKRNAELLKLHSLGGTTVFNNTTEETIEINNLGRTYLPPLKNKF
jgi:hypothetical protein